MTQGPCEVGAPPMRDVCEGLDPATARNTHDSMIESGFDPPFAPIEFSCDMTTRTGGFNLPGHTAMIPEPVRNPVTGEPHRAIIHLPEGFGFRGAEMARGTFSGTGDIKIETAGCYGFLAHVAGGVSWRDRRNRLPSRALHRWEG